MTDTLKFAMFPTTPMSATILPSRKTSRSAAMDFALAEDMILDSGEVKRASLGVGFAEPLDEDLVLLLFARSSLFKKYGVILTNGVGVIDADYPSVMQVELLNVSQHRIMIRAFETVVQGVLVQHVIKTPMFAPRDDAAFEALDRVGGFGSTDATPEVTTIPTDSEGAE